MKAAIIILTIAWWLQTTAGTPVWEHKLKAPRVEARVTKGFLLTPLAKDNVERAYSKWKTQQTIGFTLLPIGAAAIAGGGYMIYKGTSKLKSQMMVEKEENKTNDMVLVSTGVALAFLGLAISSGGLVLGIRGTVRRGKFCQGTHGVYVKTTTKAISIAYRF
jgi:hypothetical protein